MDVEYQHKYLRFQQEKSEELKRYIDQSSKTNMN